MVEQKKTRRRVNPFYVILVILGVAFALTASAYGVMAVKQMHASDQLLPGAPEHEGFVDFLDKEGPRLMLFELILLTIATAGAISTDRYWDPSD